MVAEAVSPRGFLDIVAEVLDTTTNTSTSTIAAEILQRTPPGMYREALIEILPVFVQTEMSRRRHSALRGVTQAKETSAGPSAPSSTPVITIRPATAGRGVQRVKSWKTQDDQAATDALLSMTVHIGRDDQGVDRHVPLRDCTREHLAYAIAFRRKVAAANAYRAMQLERVVTCLDRAGVTFVRDLPVGEVVRAFSSK